MKEKITHLIFLDEDLSDNTPIPVYENENLDDEVLDAARNYNADLPDMRIVEVKAITKPRAGRVSYESV